MEGEREGGNHQCVVGSHAPPTGELAHNTGPDWESNWWSLGLQAGTQSTEPHQPGHYFLSKQVVLFYKKKKNQSR